MLKKHFTKNYKSSDYYLKKKAEYSLNFILIMLFAIIIILATEMILQEDFLASLIKGGVSAGTFLVVLFIIFKGRYELGVNIMILLGFSRLMTIFFFDTPFQFYAMSVVVLLSVSVIHYKKYQFVMTNTVVLGLQVLQTLRLRILVKQGILEQRSFTEAFLSIYLFIAIIILLRNIIEIIDNEIEEREQLVRFAELDPLTSIYNRRKITKIFNNYIAQASTIRVILFDIDDFKLVNDNYGHDIGDEILLSVSKLVKEEFEEVELARWGGEEFLALTRSTVDFSEAIRIAIMKHEFPENIKITVSVGVTEVRSHDTIKSATKRADQAMYQSKQNGKK